MSSSKIIQNQQNLTKQQQAALMEQRYYVLQDLDNVLGIFAETAEVIKFFEEFPDHQMVTNAQNRFIAQVNISNSIHFDQKDDHDPLLAGNLKGLKALAKEYFKELRQQIPFTDKIDQVADHYMNQNLNENNILQQLDGVKSNSTTQLNAKTLKKIIDSMNQMDTLMGNIRAGQKVDIPTKDQFLQKMQARQLNAQNQLKQNFQKEYQESLNKKQTIGKNMEEEFIQKNTNGNQINNQNYVDNDNIDRNESNPVKCIEQQLKSKKRKPTVNQQKPISEQKQVGKTTAKCTESKDKHNQVVQQIVVENQFQNSETKKSHKDEVQSQTSAQKKLIAPYLLLLNKELKRKQQLDEKTLTTIIQDMKKKIDKNILINVFQELKNIFKSSELSKMFDQIITNCSKTQSIQIQVTEGVKFSILNDQITQINDYIKQL